MSRNMRPETRRWAPSAGVFVTADTAIDLLSAVSQAKSEINMEYADEVSRDQYRVRWNDGAAILDRFSEMDERLMSFAIAEVEELRRQPVASEEDALAFLRNIHACAESWREYLDPEDGSLELLIDA